MTNAQFDLAHDIGYNAGIVCTDISDGYDAFMDDQHPDAFSEALDLEALDDVEAADISDAVNDGLNKAFYVLLDREIAATYGE